MAIADGEVKEKKREIILRKADTLGLYRNNIEIT
jgi:hypothetical protein